MLGNKLLSVLRDELKQRGYEVTYTLDNPAGSYELHKLKVKKEIEYEVVANSAIDLVRNFLSIYGGE